MHQTLSSPLSGWDPELAAGSEVTWNKVSPLKGSLSPRRHGASQFHEEQRKRSRATQGPERDAEGGCPGILGLSGVPPLYAWGDRTAALLNPGLRKVEERGGGVSAEQKGP